MKLISVIIPVKDRITELKRTLDTVLNQSYENIEVIVAENNSKFPEEIEELIKSEYGENVHYLKVHPCKNANIARNAGANASRGEYVAFLDSDDEWESDYLASSLTHLTECDVDFVYSSAIINDSVSLKTVTARKFLAKEDPVNYLFGKNRGWAQSSSFFMTKDAFLKVSWDESLGRNQDLDYFIRCCDSLKVACMTDAKTTINWVLGEKRTIDFHSMLVFFARYTKRMNVVSKVRFFLIYFRLAKSIGDFKDFSQFLMVSFGLNKNNK